MKLSSVYYFGAVMICLNNLRLAIALVGLIFLQACAETKSGPHGYTNDINTNDIEEQIAQIVGGSEVASSKLVDSLFVLIISDNNGTPQICTGTFISKKHIITAAHCVSNDLSDLSLVNGVKPLASDEGRILTPIQVDINPGYDEKSVAHRNDLAIITIAEEINLDKKNFPQLPNQAVIQKMDTVQNFNFRAFGYGKTTSVSDTDQRTEGILRSVSLTASQITESVFRVNQTGGKGVCYGDSGGPALKTYKNNIYLVGIASGIYDVNVKQIDECQQGSLYMNIVPQISWIRTIVK